MQRTTRARLSSGVLLPGFLPALDCVFRFTDQHNDDQTNDEQRTTFFRARSSPARIMPTWIHQYKFLHKPIKPAITICASHVLAHHQNCLLENNHAAESTAPHLSP